MSDKKRKVNPTTFMAIGVCYIGAGVALSTALHNDGASVIGISISAIGVLFLVLGIKNRQKGSSATIDEEE